MNPLRIVPIVAVIVALTACAEGPLSPTGSSANDAAARGSSSTTSTTATSGRTIIALVAPAGAPYASAKGKAKFDTRSDRREFEIEVENIPAGTVVDFYLGDVKLGSGTADAFRQASLELNTQLGHSVPTAVSGQVAQARLADGTVLVSGSF